MGNLKMRPLWTLAGAYLLYLAYQQARLLLQGGAYTRGEGVLFAVSAVVFAAVGAWVLWREWKYAHAPDDSEEVADTAEDSAEFADDSADSPDDSGETEDGV